MTRIGANKSIWSSHKRGITFQMADQPTLNKRNNHKLRRSINLFDWMLVGRFVCFISIFIFLFFFCPIGNVIMSIGEHKMSFSLSFSLPLL